MVLGLAFCLFREGTTITSESLICLCYLCTRTYCSVDFSSDRFVPTDANVVRRERLLHGVFGVLRTYRDEGRPFDTQHSLSPSWAILSYPAPLRRGLIIITSYPSFRALSIWRTRMFQTRHCTCVYAFWY